MAPIFRPIRRFLELFRFMTSPPVSSVSKEHEYQKNTNIKRTRITRCFTYVDSECHGRYQTRLKKANENGSGRRRYSVLIS